jgi:hypothetical protein
LKNRKHLKSHKALHQASSAALLSADISETDPAWLKAKADDFYRHEDFQSAVNAYTEALSDTSYQHVMATAYVGNRSIAYLSIYIYINFLSLIYC